MSERHPFPLAHLRTALSQFVADDGAVLAGHLAFMGLLSLFPFLMFLVSVAGFAGQTEIGTYVIAILLESLPESVAGVLEQPIIEVMQETRGGLLTASIVGAVWTSSTGLESIRTALNRAYGASTPHRYLRRRAQSVALVIVTSAVILVGISSLLFGALIWEEFRELAGLPLLGDAVWTALRYGFSALLLFAAIAALYYLLPARKLRMRWVVPGAATALALWLVAATLFSLYLTYFNQYALTYGSLGGVIIALVFFYILGAIFIFGAELNASIARADSASGRT